MKTLIKFQKSPYPSMLQTSLKRLTLCAAACASLIWAPDHLDAQQKPNIVLIFADDLDADEINCTSKDTDIWPTLSGAQMLKKKTGKKAGDPKVLTPNIDELAKDGLMLTRFYVNATVCTSSRYCLLTGRYATRGEELQRSYKPGTHATLEWRPAILKKESSLPKELQKQGYRTGIIGKWHNLPEKVKGMPKMKKKERMANPTYKEVQGFEEKLKQQYKAGLDHLSDGFGWDVIDRMEWGNSIVNLDWQCQGALKFIEESKEQPFFLYCALPVPHGQYHFPYNDVLSYDRRVTSDGLLDKPAQVLPSDEDVTRRVKAAGVPMKNAMATRMDDYVGAIMSKLEEHGLTENTLVIFTSDHGSRGKNSVYEGGAKVPFIAVWPEKIKAGSSNDSLIGSIDVATTLIELAGGKTPADMSLDAMSFLPQLMGEAEPADWRESMLLEAGNAKGVVTKNYKYVANRVTPEIESKMKAAPRKVFWSGVDHHNYGNEHMYPTFWDTDQLFDLRKDLYENVNLVTNPEYDSIYKKMRGHMSQLLGTLPYTFGELNPAKN
jgi:arylsulfatase A-like enzyme